MPSRWPLQKIERVAAEALPQGIVDLWDAVPTGYGLSPSASESIRRSNQTAIMQNLALVGQKAIAYSAVSVGMRPELLERIDELPGVDVVREVATLVSSKGLNMGSLTAATQLVMTNILELADASTGAKQVVADVGGAVVAIAQVVIGTVTTIVEQEKAWTAYEKATIAREIECVPPAYSAAIDAGYVADGLELLKTTNWERLFLPEVSPYYVSTSKGEWGAQSGFEGEGAGGIYFTGFTCCPSTVDRGRVIVPVGAGFGNRLAVGFPPHFYSGDPTTASAPTGSQVGASYGFGCLPMCPDLLVHRGIIVPGKAGGGISKSVYDPAEALPLLGGLGVRVAQLLWNGGPASYAVDGETNAEAWSNYFGQMRRQIGRNEPGIGSFVAANPRESDWDQAFAKGENDGWGVQASDGGVCDDWSQAGRSAALAYLYERIGVDVEAATGDGIYSFENSAPVRYWRKFEEYQWSLIGYGLKKARKGGAPVARAFVKVGSPYLMIAYVDARTCHPAWRKRIAKAQDELLELGDLVCQMEVDAIPDPGYRAKVVARRQKKGPVCYAVAGKNVSAGRVSASEGPSLKTVGPSVPIPAMPEPVRKSAPPRVSASSARGWLVGLGLAGLGLAGLGLAGAVVGPDWAKMLRGKVGRLR